MDSIIVFLLILVFCAGAIVLLAYFMLLIHDAVQEVINRANNWNNRASQGQAKPDRTYPLPYTRRPMQRESQVEQEDDEDRAS